MTFSNVRLIPVLRGAPTVDFELRESVGASNPLSRPSRVDPRSNHSDQTTGAREKCDGGVYAGILFEDIVSPDGRILIQRAHCRRNCRM
jgi:hypothetical protein